MGRTGEEEGSTTNKGQESRGYRDDLAEIVEYSTSMAKISGEVSLCLEGECLHFRVSYSWSQVGDLMFRPACWNANTPSRSIVCQGGHFLYRKYILYARINV